jgi:hypothetical protein
MFTHVVRGTLCLLLLALFTQPVDAQTRSPWEMNAGEGLVAFGYTTPYHGYELEYDFATIPPPGDPGWGPAPDPDVIAFSEPSTLCGVAGCRTAGQFTYFRTFVNVPWNVMVTTFTIDMATVDDGARVTIFNSAYPTGIVVPGSYVFLGGSGTADLSSLVVSGEVNTVIVTHVDDCCSASYLGSATVVLNGEIVDVPLPVTLDIHPTSCPNPINPASQGVVPVAILGSEEFDVTNIEPGSLLLEGVPASKWAIQDVATPYDGDLCGCTEEGPDGFMDMTLKFITPTLVAELPIVERDQEIELTLTGLLMDGTEIIGRDCMVVRGRVLKPGVEETHWSNLKAIYR